MLPERSQNSIEASRSGLKVPNGDNNLSKESEWKLNYLLWESLEFFKIQSNKNMNDVKLFEKYVWDIWNVVVSNDCNYPKYGVK